MKKYTALITRVDDVKIKVSIYDQGSCLAIFFPPSEEEILEEIKKQPQVKYIKIKSIKLISIKSVSY